MNGIGSLQKMATSQSFRCGVYVRMFASRWRRVIQIFMMVNVNKTDEGEESIWAGLFWLLDHLSRKAIPTVVENGGMTGRGLTSPSIDVRSVRHTKRRHRLRKNRERW